MSRRIGFPLGLVGSACLIVIGCLVAGCSSSEAEQNPPSADPCEGFPATGFGETWMGQPSPSTRSQLRCLEPGSDALVGRFVKSIGEVSSSSTFDEGEVAHQATRDYEYPLSNPFSSHVEAYFIATQTAIAAIQAAPWLELPAVVIRTGPFSLADSQHTGSMIDLGRDGSTDQVLSAQMVAHEYGHHVIQHAMSETLTSFSGTLFEALADYIACHMGTEPWGTPPTFARACGSDASWPSGKVTAAQYCPAAIQDYKHLLWDTEYPAAFTALQKWCTDYPDAVEIHETGRIVSGALLALDSSVGKTKTLALVLQAMRTFPDATDFGGLRKAMLDADDTLYQGQDSGLIQQEFEKRGMTQDVGLIGMESQ